MSDVIVEEHKGILTVAFTPTNTLETIEFINRTGTRNAVIRDNFPAGFDLGFLANSRIKSLSLIGNGIDTTRIPVMSNLEELYLTHCNFNIDLSLFPSLFEMTASWTKGSKIQGRSLP